MGEIGRRRVIIGAGAGAGLAWAAPAVSTLGRALAQGSVVDDRCPSCPNSCNIFGAFFLACPGGNCFCLPTVEGGCLCADVSQEVVNEDVACGSLKPCTTSADCPGGACIPAPGNCCFEQVCYPRCAAA